MMMHAEGGRIAWSPEKCICLNATVGGNLIIIIIIIIIIVDPVGKRS